MNKEKFENLALYSLVAFLAMIVFYVTYTYSSNLSKVDEIAIGQEYLVKDIDMGNGNSSILITYYENDKNKTIKKMISSPRNKFNIIKTNNTTSMMVLEKVENNTHYWKVYISELI